MAGSRNQRSRGISKRAAEPKHYSRSKITNGVTLLPQIDMREAWPRRYKDLVSLFATDLGDEPSQLSQGQLQLIRRSAALAVELERLEAKFAANSGATLDELNMFSAAPTR